MLRNCPGLQGPATCLISAPAHDTPSALQQAQVANNVCAGLKCVSTLPAASLSLHVARTLRFDTLPSADG